ncbi:hypothetical protein EJD97_002336 [Solanum chilense]|uniref:S-protein homolog n=1 Tax=Solanum chilense TaxID=4083 RepID=A0A6N2BXA3_SOLCI|nr:hypothetical protein EJD97_002336 [Solanum chilense]
MQITNAFSLNPKYTLRFVSGLPQNTDSIRIHCQSKDDDIGDRTLERGDKFEFSFRMNFFGTTLYHCSFLWGLKHQNFDVFRSHNSVCGTEKLFENGYCIWLIKDTGIYLALGSDPSPDDFKFIYHWL